MPKQKISKTIPHTFKNLQLQFFAPNPKGSAPRPVPITQDEDEEEEDQEIRRSQRIRNQQSIRVQSPRGGASISKSAVYSVLGNAFLADLPQFVPGILQNSKLVFTPPPDIEEQCNGVVHPVTNETITKYKKMIDELLLCDVWMKAICIELGRLAQGYGDTK